MPHRNSIRAGLWFVLFVPTSVLVAATSAENLAKKSDDWFSSDDGKDAMSAILSWQSVHGDWPKNGDTTSEPNSGDPAKIRGTFDNGATTGELRALARAFRVTSDVRYKQAFLKGFDHILAAQYANGGWPQYFPLSKSYPRHITFNDNSMVRLMQFLRDAGSSQDFSFLDQDRRAAAAKAVALGVDCIVKCQVIVDGTPTVWCAQHHAETLVPVKARSYELASLSGSESAGVLRFLMKLPNPSPEVIRAVKSGVAWFDLVRIEGVVYQRVGSDRRLVADSSAKGLWARFYEIKTNRPFFCDRDGIPKYDIQEIGSERRNGYAWYGGWGERLAKEYAKWDHR